ncbi:DUF6807 family protein [Paenibacillus silviterrae]|uniref:DUF6807 family protein n=1 Tax=Paenibacillus silviterrae TaxID=3242194 RepID=UPI00254343C2|nr:DUF6807 family protein [Paenibacillus chinjuensis]
MKNREHPRHRSLWLAIGDVNGIDFWNEPAERHGEQLHQRFTELSDGPVCSVITAQNVWGSYKGKPQIDETRTITIYNTPAGERIAYFYKGDRTGTGSCQVPGLYPSA